ncbi:MAG TPA: pitrilysin family protein [Thermoanaerobaculia bacterium]
MRRLLASLLLLLVSTAALAQSSASSLDQFLAGVKKKTLPNGLTVITRETPGTGVVAINTWVKAGYFHEPDEVAGMAHLFEHMFFKGSKNFPGAEQISQELAGVGGLANAGTIYDTTNYYFVLPKENFERGLQIQADAAINPLFDQAELQKEAEVVIEESNRKLDNPPAVSAERMYATMFQSHRMKRWRIGSNEVLRNIKRDNLLAFFETLYRPQNMIVSIVGDVKHDEVVKAVEKTFGKLPKGTLKKLGGPSEPKQTEFRYGQSSADMRQGYTVIGWHVPGARHKDEVALSLLSSILGDGRSSRLFRNAIGPTAASTANASTFTFEDVGVFQLDASFDEKNRAEVDRRLLQEIERIKKEGPTAYELQLAKNRMESGIVLGLQHVLGQAQTLGNAEAAGDYRSLSGDLQKLQALTSQDIVDVARRYLTVDNMTLYHYRPKGTEELTRDAALKFVQDAVAATTAPQAMTAEAPAAPAPVRGATGSKGPLTSKLSNGATLVVHERPGAPVVTAGIYFRGGRNQEHSRIAGITQLMQRAMRRGTATRTAEQIDREIEFLGTQIITPLDRDYFGFALSSIARNIRPALALMADVVTSPAFPAQGIAEEKHLQKGSIRRTYDSATARPIQLFDELFYRNHPYGLPSEGYASSIDALDEAALRGWWQRNVTADDALVVIVGDIALDDAKQLAESAFGKLPKRTGPAPATDLAIVPAQRAETVEFRDRKQSAIVLGFPAVPMSHPDYVRLRLVQGIASGQAGTLFGELRSKRSLAYTVFGNIQAAAQGGAFIAYLASEAAKEEDAKKGLLTELRRLQNDAFGEPELARAKSYLAGVTRISQQTNQAFMTDYAHNHFNGVGLDFTNKMVAEAQKLTAEEIKQTAAKYFGTDNYVIAVVRGK